MNILIFSSSTGKGCQSLYLYASSRSIPCSKLFNPPSNTSFPCQSSWSTVLTASQNFTVTGKDVDLLFETNNYFHISVGRGATASFGVCNYKIAVDVDTCSQGRLYYFIFKYIFLLLLLLLLFFINNNFYF